MTILSDSNKPAKQSAKVIIVTLFFIHCLTASFQCSKCDMSDMYLDKTKSWVPFRGTMQLAFMDNTGSVKNFTAKGLDTTVINTTECGDTYKYQYITNTVYLNAARTDSIYFELFNRSHLAGRAASNNSYNFSMWDILGKAKVGIQANNLRYITVANKLYRDVIIIFRNSYSPDTLDSVIIANNIGIIGFKYFGKKYSVQ